MNMKLVEEKVIELIYREPFAPFVVEMTDGNSLQVPHPRLAVDDTGALFFGPDGGLINFHFKNVRAIRLQNSETAA